MRYRDAPTIQGTAGITTTPERAWELATDIELPVRFSEELTAVEWLVGDRVAVGHRFRGHCAHPALGRWSTDSQVVEVEPGRRWVWETYTDAGNLSATWGFEIDPGRRAVTVRQWVRLGPGPSGLTAAIERMPDKEGRIIDNRIAEWQAGIEANLRGIEALCATDRPSA